MMCQTDVRYWRRFIEATTRGLTEDQIARASARAVLETLHGRVTNAWHEAARVTGQLESCQCAPCVRARRGE